MIVAEDHSLAEAIQTVRRPGLLWRYWNGCTWLKVRITAKNLSKSFEGSIVTFLDGFLVYFEQFGNLAYRVAFHVSHLDDLAIQFAQLRQQARILSASSRRFYFGANGLARVDHVANKLIFDIVLFLIGRTNRAELFAMGLTKNLLA